MEIYNFNDIETRKLEYQSRAVKYNIPILIIFLLLVSAYNLINYCTSKNNLTHIKATVKDITISTEKQHNYTSTNININISENNKWYYINNVKDIPFVMNVVKVGDTVDIYNKSFISSILWPFNNNEIFELDSNNKQILDFDKSKLVFLYLFLSFFSLSVIFIFLRIYIKKKLSKYSYRNF